MSTFEIEQHARRNRLVHSELEKLIATADFRASKEQIVRYKDDL